MGNCVFKGFVVEEMVKVMASNSGIMELYAPMTAERVTNEFTGHALFRTNDFSSKPLHYNENLHGGQLYYLLPLSVNNKQLPIRAAAEEVLAPAPYRMSFNRVLKRPHAEVLPRYNRRGVWKVRLVISPEQLSEILGQEARTEALIESVRAVAKCSKSSLTVARLDQWSMAGSWKSLLMIGR